MYLSGNCASSKVNYKLKIIDMRTIDIKSLAIGILITVLGFALMSNSPQEETSDLTVSSHPTGILIYNSNTKQLFRYNMFAGTLGTSPKTTYIVSQDGSSLTIE